MDQDKSSMPHLYSVSFQNCHECRTSQRKYCMLKWAFFFIFFGLSAWKIYSFALSPPSYVQPSMDAIQSLFGDSHDDRPELRPHDGIISILSVVTDKTVGWGKDEPFCNVVGSSGDKPKKMDGKEYDSWIDAWKQVVGYPAGKTPPCMAKGEHSGDMIGGHVVMKGDAVSPGYGKNGAVQLVPLCDHHNAYTDAPPLTASPDVTAVLLNDYCQWPGSSCTGKSSPSTCGQGAAGTMVRAIAQPTH